MPVRWPFFLFVHSLLARLTLSSLVCRTFGKENSPYNFTGIDMRNAKNKCRQLEENHRAMKRKVNPKVLSMIDRCEHCHCPLVGLSLIWFHRAASRRRSAISSQCTSRSSRTRRKSKRRSPSSTNTRRTRSRRRGKRSTGEPGLASPQCLSRLTRIFAANSATSLPSSCQATFASCNRSRARRSPRAWRSKSAWARYGRRA